LNSTSNLCVSCGTNTASCTWTSGAIASVVCAPTYYSLSGVCTSCSAVGLGTTASPTGYAGIASCTWATPATVVTVTGCTQTAAFAYFAAAGDVVVAGCATISSTTLTYPVSSSNTYPNSNAATATILAGAANCLGLLGSVATVSSTVTGYLACQLPAALYFCPSTPYAIGSFACSLTQTNSLTFSPAGGSGSALPTNCTAGLYITTGVGTITCTTCSGGVLVAGACVTAISGCYLQTSASACSSAAAGFHLASVGANATTACSAGNPCSSGVCGTGLALNISGNCITATAISNCLVQNGTSSCAVCAANFATVIGTCGGCPS